MAIGPINYIQNVQNPFEGMDQAFANFANMRAQNEQRQYQNNLLAMKQAAAEAKAEAAARQQEDIENFINSIQNKTATARDYAIMMARYPQASEGVKRSWETLDKNQKEGQFKQMLAMDQAAHNDPVELEKMFTNTIDAAANSGNQEMASDYQEKLDLIQGKIPGVDKEKGLAIVKAKLRTGTFAIDPEYAKVVTAMEDERRKEEKQPLEVSKLGSEAIKSGVEARYAEQNAATKAANDAYGIPYKEQKLALEKERNRIALQNSAYLGQSVERQATELTDVKKPVAAMGIVRQKQLLQQTTQKLLSEEQKAKNLLDSTIAQMTDMKKAHRLAAYYGNFGDIPVTAYIKSKANIGSAARNYAADVESLLGKLGQVGAMINGRPGGNQSDIDVKLGQDAVMSVKNKTQDAINAQKNFNISINNMKRAKLEVQERIRALKDQQAEVETVSPRVQKPKAESLFQLRQRLIIGE